ncbi:MAG: hypothetical protein EON59_08295 [Alphaproteobacteria bacterium]|nr:MAG: hypothetical protein EON59_08295 [Alphaproteobacteria bacterium]
MFYDPERQYALRHDDLKIVCWSRMQSEAGQGLQAIVARKELERQAGDGVFFWGVGNAPGSEPARLARERVPIDVVFSIMKSKPKPQDVKPAELQLWRGYIDQFGVEQVLPQGALITSRAHPADARARSHYALMCRTDEPLSLHDHGPFDPSAFRNVGGRGAPVGSSQVTAMLRLVDPRPSDVAGYRANLRATLTGGYWVRLTDSIRLPSTAATSLLDRLDGVEDLNRDRWIALVEQLKIGQGVERPRPPTLFARNDRGFAPAHQVV